MDLSDPINEKGKVNGVCAQSPDHLILYILSSLCCSWGCTHYVTPCNEAWQKMCRPQNRPLRCCKSNSCFHCIQRNRAWDLATLASSAQTAKCHQAQVQISSQLKTLVTQLDGHLLPSQIGKGPYHVERLPKVLRVGKKARSSVQRWRKMDQILSQSCPQAHELPCPQGESPLSFCSLLSPAPCVCHTEHWHNGHPSVQQNCPSTTQSTTETEKEKINDICFSLSCMRAFPLHRSTAFFP